MFVNSVWFMSVDSAQSVWIHSVLRLAEAQWSNMMMSIHTHYCDHQVHTRLTNPKP